MFGMLPKVDWGYRVNGYNAGRNINAAPALRVVADEEAIGGVDNRKDCRRTTLRVMPHSRRPRRRNCAGWARKRQWPTN